MNVPKTHPGWSGLIDGTTHHDFKTLSASLMLIRLNHDYKTDPTPAKMAQCIDTAYEFFTRYEALFQDDLRVLFPKGECDVGIP